MPRRCIPPDEVYGELFQAVQLGGMFDDSKTFVDAAPRKDPAEILRAFEAQRGAASFDLDEFVREHFLLPAAVEEPSGLGGDVSIRQYIERLWDVLYRRGDESSEASSLIPLPNPYIVPGGRFREIYYWDSYFSMLGLAASGRTQLIQAMVDNFAHLIDRIGFIPNGNRTYYCSRSQPPLFASMVRLLAEVTDEPEMLVDYLGPLEKEYSFWMAGVDRLQPDEPACRRVVLAGNEALNRYWDDVDRPRQESYLEDLRLARGGNAKSGQIFREIRAACESGWDFSSRWLTDERDETSIRTTQVVPVDLNAILFDLESTLADASRLANKEAERKFFEQKAETRKRLIQDLFFDSTSGFFVDLLLPDLRPSGCRSLAAAFPLLFGIATTAQAEQVCRGIEREFVRPGGWVTTLESTGQQWDAPNGWAPLQWVVYAGLKRYGFSREARHGARCWVKNNIEVYKEFGRLLEKYNVEEIGAFAGGGEYAVQHGFGWTNGVLLRLMDDLGIE